VRTVLNIIVILIIIKMCFPVVATTVTETEIAVATKAVFFRSSVLALVRIPPEFWVFYVMANNTSGHSFLRSRGGAVV
jgi:hypothetical protein